VDGFDGRLRFVTGLPRSGKTSFTLSRMARDDGRPYTFVCTGPSNPSVVAMPWVPDTDEGLQMVWDNPKGITDDKGVFHASFSIRCLHANPQLFEVLENPNRTYCLDEVGNICSTYELKESLKKWAREVGWKNGGLDAWATSQRPTADVPPGVYVAAREIYWVGPCKSNTVAKVLYEHRTADWTEEEFSLKLATLQKFDFKLPNMWPKSVLQIKDA